MNTEEGALAMVGRECQLCGLEQPIHTGQPFSAHLNHHCDGASGVGPGIYILCVCGAAIKEENSGGWTSFVQHLEGLSADDIKRHQALVLAGAKLVARYDLEVSHGP